MDFLEILLTPKEYQLMKECGVVEEFNGGLKGIRGLNVFIRIMNHGEMNATKEGKEQKSYIRKHQGDGRSRTSSETSGSSGPIDS